MKARHLLPTAVAAVALTVGTAAAFAAPHARTAAATPTIAVHSSAYGKILVNGKGDTLYLWVKDKNDKSSCNTACESVWPFVLVSGKPTAGPGLNAKLLGTIKVKGGNEVTYDKHPLYTFVSDVKPGVISGEGNTTFGGAWWVVSPSGSPITKKP
jgi:predicted lipoprotein with Yx(FWY)xxD motif